MSDAPKKVGSLRDRIAAFEKQPAASSGPTGPPAPRPKPGGLQWKPRQPSPPPAVDDPEAAKKAGMSASDAKETIGKGVSLKDRMAALQNRGAFGATSPPPLAPKPAVEKPKWKPPPVVSPPVDDDEDAPKAMISPPLVTEGEQSEQTEEASQDQGEAEKNAEEERERRAAIAARMARLGGARVGMAPPVLGRKPKPAEVPREEETKPAEGETEAVAPLPTSTESAAPEPVESTDTAVPEPSTTSIESTEGAQVPSAASSLDATSPPAQSTSPPAAGASPRMPVPAAPRRAAPPRKKAAKSPPPVAEPTPSISEVSQTEPEQVSFSSIPEEAGPKGDREEEIGQVHKSADNVPEVSHEQEAPSTVLPDQDNLIEEPSSFHSEEAAAVPSKELEELTLSPKEEEQETKAAPEIPVQQTSQPLTSEPEAIEEQEDEDEEEARRKRVAEKLAKMGGINPLAPPPPRRQSTLASEESAPTAQGHQKRASVSSVLSRKDSVDIPVPAAQSPDHGPPPPIPRKSIDSVRSARKPSLDVPVVLPSAEEQSPVKLAYDTGSEHADEPRKSRVDDDEQTNEAYEAHEEQRRGDEDRYDQDDQNQDQLPKKAYDDEAQYNREEDLQDPDEPTVSSPPPVPVSTRPVSIRSIPRRSVDESDGHDAPEPVLAPSPKNSTRAPPPAAVAEASDSEADGLDQSQTLRYLLPRTAAAVVSPPPAPSPPPERVPPPRRQSSLHVSAVEEKEEGSTVESDGEADMLPPPVPPNRPQAAAPPAHKREEEEEEEAAPSDDDEPEQDEEQALPHPSRPMPPSPEVQPRESALPTPPRRGVPPPPPPVAAEDTPMQTPALDEHSAGIASYFRKQSEEYESAPPAPEASSDSMGPAQEILDEDEGDPIDPSFHSPKDHSPMASSPARVPTPPQAAELPSPPPPPHQKAKEQEPEGEDEEQTRRRTIAERMAKLGGIRFGAPPPIGKPPPRRQPTIDDNTEVEPAGPQETEEPATQLTEEEEETARKQRIAAKLATMGGMRFGMFPPGVQAAPARRASTDISREDAPEPTASSPPPLPPSRPPPPPSSRPPPTRAPPPPTVEHGSDLESSATSDDGVRVEAEESEMEEVSHQDVVEEPEEFREEEAPPVPSRAGRAPSSDTVRKSSVASVGSGGRPPVPAGVRSPSSANRKSSSGSAYVPTSPRASTQRPSISQHPTQSDFVMVGSPEADAVSPPQRRASLAPTRGIPPPPQPSVKHDPSESVSSQWELPSFEEPAADLSLSWSEDSTMYPTEHKRVSQLTGGDPMPTSASGEDHRGRSLPSNLQLSADELMSIWGKVGVHVCTAATGLFEQSKKTLVGDGTYSGFIRAALKEVPAALVVDSPPNTFGYMIYLQNGASVQKRASEILPGDVVVVTDAKFKGHKGLQSYSQHVGAGAAGSTLGVVSEFEPKKSKVKVFQANQHVGQQTVEAVSYRLDDLKSGTIQVYRVLEA